MSKTWLVMFLSGGSEDVIKKQYDKCRELIEQRYDNEISDEVRAEHIMHLRDKAYKATHLGDDDLTIIADRYDDIDRDGYSPAKCVEKAINGHADEIMIAKFRNHILNPGQISDFLRRGIGKITVAEQRLSFEQGIKNEHIHRVQPVIKDTTETRDGDEVLVEEWTGGRPPIGCEVIDGQLVQGEDYLDVRRTLQKVVFDGLSKSEASREIGCARKTINNTINDRAELFNLPQQ